MNDNNFIKNNYLEENVLSEKYFITIIAILTLVMYIMIKQYIVERDIAVIYCSIFLFIIFLILIAVSYYIGVYRREKFIAKRDIILSKGVHVIGEIISKEKIYTRVGYRDSLKVYYFVEVKFNYNNEHIEIQSPYLTFKTDYITSDFVDVYIYNNEYYITNYRIDTEMLQSNIKKCKKHKKIEYMVFYL